MSKAEKRYLYKVSLGLVMSTISKLEKKQEIALNNKIEFSGFPNNYEKEYFLLRECIGEMERLKIAMEKNRATTVNVYTGTEADDVFRKVYKDWNPVLFGWSYEGDIEKGVPKNSGTLIKQGND